MSIIESKSILFIKAPLHNLRSVEHFLQKRNFKVFIEIDVKMALAKVIGLQPSVIFLAWDHPNAKILELPEALAKSTEATIIPYVMGFTKEDVKKLDHCTLNPKLYPPISGPAIERLIAKFSKTTILKNSDYDEIVNKYKTEKEHQSKVAAVLAPPAPQPPEVTEAKAKLRFIIIKQQQRQEMLLHYKKSTLSSEITAHLKKSLPIQVKIPLQQMLITMNSPGAAPVAKEIGPLRAYCLSVYSEGWCGYLTTLSNRAFEPGALKNILTAWINEHFENVVEPDEHDFVELENVDASLSEDLERDAEYYERLQIENYEISVSFFSVDPARMSFELNDDASLIKMATSDIPPDTELPFSLHLHLPENKKYIVYTQANKKLSLEQKNRLIGSKIILLYTPLNFGNEYKKFVAQRNIKDFCLNHLKKKSAI